MAVTHLKISKQDFDYMSKYAEHPFDSFQVTKDPNGQYDLAYSTPEEFDKFGDAYDEAWIAFGSDKPEHNVNAIGRRLEKIYDDLCYQ